MVPPRDIRLQPSVAQGSPSISEAQRTFGTFGTFRGEGRQNNEKYNWTQGGTGPSNPRAPRDPPIRLVPGTTGTFDHCHI